MSDTATISMDELKSGIADAVADATSTAISKALTEFQAHAQTAAAAGETDEAREGRVKALETELQELKGKGDEQAQKIEVLEKAAAEREKIRWQAGKGRIDLDCWPAKSALLARTMPRDPEMVTDEDRHAKSIQRINDDLVIIAQMAKEPGQDVPVSRKYQDAAKAAKAYLADLGLDGDNAISKALDTYTSGGAADWVQTELSSDFIESVNAETEIAMLLPQFTMTAKTVTLPGSSGTATAYRKTGAENAAKTEDAALSSRSVSWTAEDLALRRDYSDNLDEDSIVSLQPFVRAELTRGLAEAIDKAILDGDTTAAHQDSDIDESTGPESCWIGFRKQARTNSGANQGFSGGLTADGLASMPANMQRFSKGAVWVYQTHTYFSKILLLKDADDNLMFQPNQPGVNPIVTGQVGMLLGFPVVWSDLVRKNLNASGVYDGVTTNYTYCTLVNRNAWALGVRRNATIEADKDITTGSFRTVLTWRGDLQHLHGTNLTTAIGYAIDAS